MWQEKILANSLSQRIGGEIFGEFGIKSLDTKLVSKILVNGGQFTKFDISPAA